MIEVKNVSKKYGKIKALDNISFNIEEGKITCILGINGVGKSTVLKCIAGLIIPDKGEILIDNEKISPNIYNKVSFVPDVDNHFAQYTIKESFEFMKHFYKNWDDEKAYEMLKLFNLTDDRKISKLSKGNIARVKIILGFAQNAKYTLLDEPFSGIDIFKREEFLGVMTKYIDEEQSIILTTHEISEIEMIADDVILIDEGKVSCIFNAEELRTREGMSIVDKMREVYRKVNNILTLYDMEFKRIYKIYFTLIGILLASNIGATLFSIYSVPSRTSDIEGNPITVNVLKSEEGIRYIYEYLIGDLTSITKMAVAFSVLLCLLYSLVIWYRDYFSKSKTIATLLMLPQKRFNIYISKFLTVIMMIFGIIASQFLFWFIDLVIIKIILNVNTEGFLNVFKTMLVQQNMISNLVFNQPIDFMMVDILGVILAVTVLFTGVIIERSFRKIGVVLGSIYVVASIGIYIYVTVSYCTYSDILLKAHLLYYILMFIVSILISINLLNKRVSL